MKRQDHVIRRYVVAQPARVTLGDQVRAEARRRGEAVARFAARYAAQAEQWYGWHPLRGDELRLVYDEVFGLPSVPEGMTK